MLLGQKRARWPLIVAPVALGVTVWILWPRASAEAIVRRGIECLETQDAECLFRLAEKGELESYGLSQVAFERLLRTYVFQGPWTKEGQPTVRPGPIRGGYQAQVYFTQHGDPVAVGILAANTGEKNELVSLVTSLILSRMPPSEPSDPPGARMLKWIARDRGALTSLGVLGINRNDGFLTWDELETRYRNMPQVPKKTDSR